VQPYERFRAWEAAHQLALNIYLVTSHWPAVERYGLTAQVRRAALAVPTNLVEGSSKRGPKEFGRFLDVSVGSLAELGYMLRFARDAGILLDTKWQDLEHERAKTARSLWCLYRAVRLRQR
jgi:four helix bundle protein